MVGREPAAGGREACAREGLAASGAAGRRVSGFQGAGARAASGAEASGLGAANELSHHGRVPRSDHTGRESWLLGITLIKGETIENRSCLESL